jgi:hypothetical protein
MTGLNIAPHAAAAVHFFQSEMPEIGPEIGLDQNGTAR